jgi:hypothetical protein
MTTERMQQFRDRIEAASAEQILVLLPHIFKHSFPGQRSSGQYLHILGLCHSRMAQLNKLGEMEDLK